MPMFSRRPASLAHISDEAAAKALSRHFGDMVPAAKDLGISAPELRRLTWANPAILDAAHERMSLFVFCRKDEIMRGLHSRRASDRRRAVDGMAANPGLFGDLTNNPAFALLAPASSVRGSKHVAAAEKARVARECLSREVAAEAAAERDREAELERDREAAAEREGAAVMVDRRATTGRVIERSPARDSGFDLRPENVKYASVCGGLTRGRR